MKKFLFIYNPSSESDSGSDEDWMAWFTSISESMIDMGNPFNGGTLVKAGRASEITQATDFVGGYSLVSAQDMTAAIALAKNCPNAAGLRIFEALPM